MANPKDQKLWDSIREEAKKKFKAFPSAYASFWITAQYRKRGGTFLGPKPEKSGITRWANEKWVDICSPIGIKDGKVIYKTCGRQKSDPRKYPLCRPSARITKKTPKTVYEIDHAQVKKMCQQKHKKGKDIRMFFIPKSKPKK